METELMWSKAAVLQVPYYAMSIPIHIDQASQQSCYYFDHDSETLWGY